MRRRFFLTILAVLFSVSIVSIYLYSLFLRKERLALIDHQVRETAAALIDSELGDVRKINFDDAEAIISEELGESRIGKFFIIRNQQGETIFESSSAQLLPIAEVPQDQQWFEISTKGQFIRGLNLKLPRIADRTLQVGLVLDEKLVNPSYFSESSFILLAAILVLGLVVSFASTSYLLQPIAKLDKFLASITSATSGKTLLPEVPPIVGSLPKSPSGDEFARLVTGLNQLIRQVNRNYEFSRLWGYQMAHELKTPLSLVQVELEKLQKKHQLTNDDIGEVTYETGKISETINSFLGWAELENSTQQKHLFVNDVGSVVKEVLRVLPESAERIRVEFSEPIVVAANPGHLEQLVQNLIYNAIKHAGDEARIRISIADNALAVEDSGPGIPEEVLARIGEPFNRGTQGKSSVKGHGLGLAWVTSICRHYGWPIVFLREEARTKVIVKFAI